MNIENLKELAEDLTQTTPADTEEMALVCAELHAARDLEDAIDAEMKADEQLQQLLKRIAELKEPYRVRQQAVSAVVAAATGALVRRIEADEQATLDAVQKRADVPAPTALPKGLRVTRKTVLASVDMQKLPETFWTVVADTAAILRHAEAGHDVPGATVETKLGCVYTRGKK